MMPLYPVISQKFLEASIFSGVNVFFCPIHDGKFYIIFSVSITISYKGCYRGGMMKTFKLVSFRIRDKTGKRIQIPLVDGLAINQENERRTWLLEVFFDKKYLPYFEVYQKNEGFPVSVKITREENDPAFFQVRVVSWKTIDRYATVLMEGNIRPRHIKYAEELLETLIQQGLAGDELLEEFKKAMAEFRNTVKR